MLTNFGRKHQAKHARTIGRPQRSPVSMDGTFKHKKKLQSRQTPPAYRCVIGSKVQTQLAPQTPVAGMTRQSYRPQTFKATGRRIKPPRRNAARLRTKPIVPPEGACRVGVEVI